MSRSQPCYVILGPRFQGFLMPRFCVALRFSFALLGVGSALTLEKRTIV